MVKDGPHDVRAMFPHYNEGVLGFGDFLIRVDLMAVQAVARRSDLESTIEQEWQHYLAEIAYNPDWLRNCIFYIRESRFWLQLLSRGERISGTMMRIKALIHFETLLTLTDLSTHVDLKAVMDRVITSLSGVVSDRATMVYRLNEIMNQYFSSSPRMNPATFTLLCEQKDSLEGLRNQMRDSLTRGAPAGFRSGPSFRATAATLPEIKPRASVGMSESRINLARLECLMEVCVDETKESALSRESLIQSHWQAFFPEMPYGPSALSFIFSVINNKTRYPYLGALDTLFRLKSLTNVSNPRNLRAILVARSARLVLAKMPPDSTIHTLTDETLSLLERFDFLSTGKEEEDVAAYLSTYTTDEGIMDRGVIRLLREHVGFIKEVFSKTETEVNSKNPYMKVLLKEHQEEIEMMRQRVERSDIATLAKFMEKLASGEYGYTLGNLYRFAEGLDSPDYDRLRNLAENLFHILSVMGVMPIGEDLIDQPFTMENVYAGEITRIKYAYIEEGESRVVYPGWSVMGERIVSPVGFIAEEDQR